VGIINQEITIHSLALAKGKKAEFVEEYIINGKKKQKNSFKCRLFDAVELGMNK
jgi:hypothetical protein